MEEEKSLTLPDGKTLYYVHSRTAKPNRKLVVHIHGLAGSAFDYAPARMARKFPSAGYDVIRPYLYYWKEGARALCETTIALSAEDVKALINHVHKDYERIFITAHSYGGPSAMLLQDCVDAVSLWDVTYVPQIGLSGEWVEKIGDAYFAKGSFNPRLGKAMVDEAQMWSLDYARRLAATWEKPIQAIHAGDGFWIKKMGAESFHTQALGVTEYRVITGSVHYFAEEGTTSQLLDATKGWFSRF